MTTQPDSDASPTGIVETGTSSAGRQKHGGLRFGRYGRLILCLVCALLFVSVMFNLVLYWSYGEYLSDTAPIERFHSGDVGTQDRIALLRLTGTVMPPFTERLLSEIKRAEEDDRVKGAILVVDSPGGLVADSHQIYHRLQKLAEKKPIFVSMKRMAASGGYYISMGAGASARIYAEPTTWTGSIGVIIPRYNAATLAEKLGVAAEPLATGPYKDSLNPFRELSDDERAVWDAILQDAFDRFVDVIAQNRTNLDHDAVGRLATGQVYTALQAIDNGLVDRIGFLDDVVDDMQSTLGLESVRVVAYQSPRSMLDLVLSINAPERQPSVATQIIDATVPRAMYFCSWGPAVPYRGGE